MSWHRKHLLDIESLTAEELTAVLETAREFKAVGERDIKKVPALQGKTVVNFFVEPSTRTRVSFELSAKRLSADIINFSTDASSFQKGESLKDTARNLEALMRTSLSSATRPRCAALPRAFLNAHVVNAGDGAHEHPLKPSSMCSPFVKRKAHRRPERHHPWRYSIQPRGPLQIWALRKLGANVTLCGPSTLVPRVFEEMGCRVTYNLDEALADADVINLLRIQHERQRKTMFPSIGEYARLFGLNRKRLTLTKPEAMIMHPGPMNRGWRSKVKLPMATGR